MKRTAIFLALVLCLALPRPAAAFHDKVLVAVISPGTINIDGNTQDWYEADYPVLSMGKNEIVYGASGWKGEDDYSMDAFLANDDTNLYMAFAVDDDRQVRSKKPSIDSGEDHVEIWIDMPPYGAENRRVIQFFPERNFPTFHPALRVVSGEKWKKMKGAKFSMESGKGGWEAEIVIPLSAIPGLDNELVATRWAIVATDSDTKTGDPVRHTVLATSGTYDAGSYSESVVQARTVALENVDGVLGNFLKNHKLSKGSVKLEFKNVAMDKRLEILVIGGPVIGILGPGFMSGASYTYVKLPVSSSGDVLSVKMRDVSGNGLEDIVVKYREKNDLGSRVMVAVYAFVVGEVRRILAQELEVRSGSKSITCSAQFLPDGPDGSEMLLVTPGAATGWSKISYKNMAEYGVGAVLAPWDKKERVLWILKGFDYEPAEEDKIDSYLEPEPEKGKKKKKKKKGK